MVNLKDSIKQDSFNRFLMLSFMAHLTFVALFFLNNIFNGSQNTIVYERAIRVDLVGLPEKNEAIQASLPKGDQNFEDDNKDLKLPPPEKKVESKSDKKTEAKNDSRAEADKSNIKNTQKLGIEKLKQLSAIEKLQNEMAKQSKASPSSGQSKIVGNKVASGHSLTGVDKLEAEDYIASVEEHVKSFWRLPQYLSNKKLKAKVAVKWNAQGNLIQANIYESSGQQDFDQIALDTIKAASPLPVPPEKFIDLTKNVGILFGFPD